MRNVLLPAVVLGSLFAFGLLAQAAEDGVIAGRVYHRGTDDPLPGVELRLAASWSGEVTLPDKTGSDGAFEFQPSDYVGPEHLDTYEVLLTFNKDGFFELAMLLKSKDRGLFNIPDVIARLEPSEGLSSLSVDEKDSLSPYKSLKGRTIFVLPYLTAWPGDFDLRNFSYLLRYNLNTKIQELAGNTLGRGDYSHYEIHVSALEDIGSAPASGEKLRRYGRELNGLAMVSGFAELSNSVSQEEIASVISDFIIIPTIPQLSPPWFSIRDEMPQKSFNTTAMVALFDSNWSFATCLALGIKEYVDARDFRDTRRMTVLKNFLNAVKEHASTTPDPTFNRIEALLELL